MNKRFMCHTATLSAVMVASLTVNAVIVRADSVKVTAGIGRPYMLADGKQLNYIKVRLDGGAITDRSERVPVNVALVIDRSGSMAGDKIRRAREAAIQAIDRLGKDDVVSVIAYDDTVEVLVPATKVSDRDNISRQIQRLQPGNSTALFAGVSKGAAEARKFLDRDRVNRVILLSDGLANVGPSSPSALGELGASLIREGISVTTIGLGLGYNEDLMTQLAHKSDGNHGFAKDADDLARIFNYEFGDIMSVCAKEVIVRIRCKDGVRPVRILGREGDITGSTASFALNQLYAEQQKCVILEVEAPAGRDLRVIPIASVEVSYLNMASKTTTRVTHELSARYTESASKVEASEDHDVMASAIEMIAIDQSNMAVALRDQGKVEEARSAMEANARFCDENAKRYNSDSLRSYRDRNKEDAANLSEDKWNEQRKTNQLYNDGRARSQIWY
jgi:Ca-activated chloride channel family protein